MNENQLTDTEKRLIGEIAAHREARIDAAYHEAMTYRGQMRVIAFLVLADLTWGRLTLGYLATQLEVSTFTAYRALCNLNAVDLGAGYWIVQSSELAAAATVHGLKPFPPMASKGDD